MKENRNNPFPWPFHLGGRAVPFAQLVFHYLRHYWEPQLLEQKAMPPLVSHCRCWSKLLHCFSVWPFADLVTSWNGSPSVRVERLIRALNRHRPRPSLLRRHAAAAVLARSVGQPRLPAWVQSAAMIVSRQSAVRDSKSRWMNFPVWGLSVESGNGAMCRSRTSGVRGGAEQSGVERISTRPRPLATTTAHRWKLQCIFSSASHLFVAPPCPEREQACSGRVEASTRDRSRKKVLRNNSPNRAYDDFLPLQARLQAFSSLSILSRFVCLEYLLSVTVGIDAWNLLFKKRVILTKWRMKT